MVFTLIIALYACRGKLHYSSRQEIFKVPIAINIRGDNSVDYKGLNPDLYRQKIKNFLTYMGGQADLVLVENYENPDVILNIDVKDFLILPEKEVTTSQTERRSMQVGTDAKGQPIYQTMTITTDQIRAYIGSTARLKSSFTFKDPSFKVRPQNYFSGYTWSHQDINANRNVRRSASGPFASSRFKIIPIPDDFLFQLSEEMLYRVSYDLQKYYKKIND